MGIKDKYKKILNVIILGISIFLIEFIVQLILIILLNKLFLNDLFSGHINNPLIYNNETIVWGAKNVFYTRFLIYLPIWLIFFSFSFSNFKIRNPIIRLICFDLLMMAITFVLTIVISIYFVSKPFIYYLALSIIITPIIINTIPYFRNFLKSLVELESKQKE